MTLQDYSIILSVLVILSVFSYALVKTWPVSEPAVWAHGKVVGYVTGSRRDADGDLHVTMQITDYHTMKLLQGDSMKGLSLGSVAWKHEALEALDNFDINYNRVAMPILDPEAPRIQAFMPRDSFIQDYIDKDESNNV